MKNIKRQIHRKNKLKSIYKIILHLINVDNLIQTNISEIVYFPVYAVAPPHMQFGHMNVKSYTTILHSKQTLLTFLLVLYLK